MYVFFAGGIGKAKCKEIEFFGTNQETIGYITEYADDRKTDVDENKREKDKKDTEKTKTKTPKKKRKKVEKNTVNTDSKTTPKPKKKKKKYTKPFAKRKILYRRG